MFIREVSNNFLPYILSFWNEKSWFAVFFMSFSTSCRRNSCLKLTWKICFAVHLQPNFSKFVLVWSSFGNFDHYLEFFIVLTLCYIMYVIYFFHLQNMAREFYFLLHYVISVFNLWSNQKWKLLFFKKCE